jgi:tetratricopeptide (TPR) repeat protein
MRLRNPVIVTTFVLSLSACAVLQPAADKTAQAPAEATQATAADTPGLDASQHLDRALKQLQAGQYEAARPDLEAVLALEPGHWGAASLLAQLDADPEQELGSEHFSYTIQPGDSLSRLAKRHLGDRYKFVILARYNQLENPGRLMVGQTLRIPGKAPAAPAAAKKVAAPAAVTAPKVAAAATPGKGCAAGIPELEQRMAQSPTASDREQLVGCYSEQADALAAAGDVQGAQALLQKALVLDRTNAEVAQRYMVLSGAARAGQLYQQGLAQLQDGKLDDAAATFEQVLAQQPDHAAARTQLANVNAQLADRYHRMALSLYERELMDSALTLWNKALELKPDHKEALAYVDKVKARQ